MKTTTTFSGKPWKAMRKAFAILKHVKTLALILVLFIFASEIKAQTVVTITTSGSWTVPAGVTSVAVYAFGGGGGSGSGYGSCSYSGDGGGGGGGGFAGSTLTVSAGQTYTVTIGAGGTGGAAGTAAGTAGGTTTFTGTGGTVSAAGGSGGAAPSCSANAAGGAGGAGITGTTLYTGGAGSWGTSGGTNTGKTGSGGGGAGSGANGGTVTGGTCPGSGGAGGTGTYPGGAGGYNTSCTTGTSSTTLAGSAGTIPGGGGGGPAAWTSCAGGNGGAGQVVLVYTVSLPAPTVTSFSPTSGCAGTTVIITGTNFSSVTSVKFGGVNATSYVVNSTTMITAVVGATATGTVSVTTSSGTGTSAGTFTIGPPAVPTGVTANLANPLTVCANTSVSLNATSAGNAISWFTASSGGSALGTVASGTNYVVTPVATTTYYAETEVIASGSSTFNYVSAATQSWTVPSGVSSVNVQMWGAGGGSGYMTTAYEFAGGSGAYMSGTLSGLTPGQVLTLYVPHGGYYSTATLGGAGGWPGGGQGGNDAAYTEIAGGGGGYAGITIGGTYYCVAGAGGGGGSSAYGGDAHGGGGGATTGGTGGIASGTTGGGGGTVAAGGAAGAPTSIATAGSSLTGGIGDIYSGYYGGGGGGAGYYGGGGGNYEGGGGGGGSSYPGSTYTFNGITFTITSNLAGTIYTGTTVGGTALAPGSPSPSTIGEGIEEGAGGNGQIILSWAGSACASASRVPVVVTLNPTPTAVTVSGGGSACGSAVLTASGGTGGSIYWENTTSGGTSTVLGTTPQTVTSSGTYYFRAYNGTCWGTQGSAAVTINPNAALPSPVTASPTLVCGGGTSSLNATSAGNTINWYTVSTGGTAIATGIASGANYVVTPAAATTYYAESQTIAAGSSTFTYTGAMQPWTVPTGVTSITVDAYGAQGGSYTSTGGLGGHIQATGVAVTAGNVLDIYVGGQAGYNGGGTGGGTYSAVGGGASDVRVSPYALANRLVVGGGGGGAGDNCGTTQEWGGAGGGTTGVTGWQCNAQITYTGTGGTQAAGGTSQDGLGTAGALGVGGNGYNPYGGGGGGGYYGGGGASYGGGGGGSSYTAATIAVNAQGVQSGNGQVVITWNGVGCPSASRVPVVVNVGGDAAPTGCSVSSPSVCPGASTTLTGTPFGGDVLYWYSGSCGGTYVGSGNSLTVNPITTTTYYPSSWNGACAGACATPIVVTVNTVPAITAMTSTVCNGVAFTVTPVNGTNGTVPAGTTYSWGLPTVTGGMTGGATGSASANINGTLFNATGTAQTGTYTVTPTYNGCSGSTFTVIVTVNPSPAQPSPVTATPSTVCPGGTSSLSGTSAGNTMYWWTASTGGTNLGTSASGASFPVAPGASTTYYVESNSTSVGSTTFTYTGTIPTWTVPAGVTSINITAAGAQGSSYSSSYLGGLGAVVTGTFTVTPGQVLSILAGQQYCSNCATYAGGGGGTYVANGASYTTATPMIVAGGGGGCYSGGVGAQGGLVTNVTTTGDAGGVAGYAGTNGNGATSYTCGGGGGGFYTKGGDDLTAPTYGPGGQGFRQGGAGAVSVSYGNGGFGGGATADYYGACYGWAGSGGGYSGGSGYTVATTYIGYGGGSYNSGTSQTNTAASNSGNGYVTISWNVAGCASAPRVPVAVNIGTPAVPSSISATPSSLACGGSVSLNATSAGSNINWYTVSTGGTILGTVASGADFTVTPNVTTTYYAEGFTTCASGTRTPVTVTVTGGPAAPTPATATPATVCPGVGTSLNATAVGYNINWYTVSTGGSSLATVASGANYAVTPASTTTYYAETNSGASGSSTFNYVSNATQSWTVPSGVTSVNVQLWGAGGGGGYYSTGTEMCGGSGAYISGTLSGLTGGSTVLTLYVPAGGGYSTLSTAGGTGGWPGGGVGDYSCCTEMGGGGGGYAAINIGGTYYVVAGAGGGGGADTGPANGGGGGATSGSAGGIGAGTTGGGGGTLTAGGAVGTATYTETAGGYLTGGNGGNESSGNWSGGGGGAGYYGGGAGNEMGGGGGGGSSYPGSSFTSSGITFTLTSNTAGTTNATTSGVATAPGSPPVGGTGNGNRTAAGGNGLVVISWNASGCLSSTRTPVVVNIGLPAAPTPVSATPNSVLCGASVSLNATSVPGNTINWYTVSSGGTSIGTSASAANYTVTVTGSVGTVTYYAESFSSCASSSRNPVTVTITGQPAAPTPAIATPSAICPSGTSSLSATAVGYSINWYTASSGGSPIGTSTSGGNYVVNPASTTTYYAETNSGSAGSTSFTYTGTIPTWTVPTGVTSITITAAGAQGSSYSSSYLGGLGAVVTGTFAVTGGQVLSILVGQQYCSNCATYAGGGGGTYVANGASYTTATPMIVAGGGGGCYSGGVGAQGGLVTNVTTTGDAGGVAGYAGTNGNGATSYTCGGGGGGFYTKGGDDLTAPTYGPGGQGFRQGGAGAVSVSYGNGGFGGGATADYYGACYGWAGSGGGYSGGSGYTVATTYIGYGGGSYNSGTSQTNTAASNSGNGYVNITWNVTGCTSLSRTPVTVNIGLSAPTPATATPSSLCTGSSVSLNATSSTGSNVNWYNVSSGGTPLANVTSAANYTVTPTGSGTYYAETNITGTSPATYNFTNCGVTGRLGPTQAQATAAYSSTSLAGAVTVPYQGIQQWTVPYTGNYTFTVKGASGGSIATYAGYGAQVTGTQTLTAGTVLDILVGQMGSTYATTYSDGGGGGSFVASGASYTTATPLFVAGGGGGAAQVTVAGQNASTTTSPVSTTQQTFGSQGAGFSANGVAGSYAMTWPTVAQSFTNGGNGQAGGTAGGWPGTNYGDGGYGGGGSSCSCSTGGGGGGGGYVGGGGGGAGYTSGYGGSSYIVGTATSTSASVLAAYGNGSVTINFAGSPGCISSIRTAVPVTVNSTPVAMPALAGTTTICDGATTTLSISLPTGGTITTSGGYRVHTFTSSGSFVVPTGFSGNVNVLVVGGGGGGGANGGGGGGGGAVITSNSYNITSGSSTTVTIGAGGGPSDNSSHPGITGGASSFGSLSAAGGGGGASRDAGGQGTQGGSGAGGGGGGGGSTLAQSTPGAANGTGGAGGNGTYQSGSSDKGCWSAGGGGGGAGNSAGTAGTTNSSSFALGGNGGAGLAASIPGFSGIFGGGGGGNYTGYAGCVAGMTLGMLTVGTGGTGGGGAGNVAGTANTGGGAGAATAGGSGIVIVSYPDITAGNWTSGSGASVVANTPASSAVVTGTGLGGTPTVTYTVANACSSSLVSATVTVSAPATTSLVSTDYVWSGNTSTDWSTTSNWLAYNGSTFSVAGSLPTATNNVFVRAYGACASLIPTTSATSNCNNLTIEAGKSLTMGAQTLNVYGNWLNYGTFTAGTGTVSFVGNSAQTIDGSSPSTFNNLTINNTGGPSNPVSLALNTNVNGACALTTGALKLNGHTLTLTNNSTSAIGSTGGYILSNYNEPTFASSVAWVIGSGSGTNTYVFPFGYDAADYIPFTFKLNSGNIGTLTLSTYSATGGTLADMPTNPSVTNLNLAGTTSTDGSGYVVKRFWLISPSGSGNSDITFSYAPTGIENPINGLDINGMRAQRWNTTDNDWEYPFIAGQTNPTTYSVTVPGVTNFSPWTVTGFDEPLPVELLSFNAKCDNSKVDLNWSTASETNNDYFSIDKSKDYSDWYNVGTVPGSGTTNSVHMYSTTDNSPFSGTSYYRLKQVDYNGNSKTYNPVATECIDAELNSLGIVNVYTDDSKDELVVVFNAPQDGNVKLYLIDDMGQRLTGITYSSVKGVNTVKIPLNSSLVAGIYMVTIEGMNNKVVSKRIFIQ